MASSTSSMRTLLRSHPSDFCSYVAVDLTITEPDLLFDFWRGKSNDLPNWHAAAMKVATLPTSNAAVERLVSVLTRVLGDHAFSSKEDTIECRCLLGYNRRKKARRRKHRFDDNVPDEVLRLDGSDSEDEEELDQGAPGFAAPAAAVAPPAAAGGGVQ
jgi:hypothetical protein